MAKWLDHLPFISRFDSQDDLLEQTRKSWVFSGYFGFFPQGKLTGRGRLYGPTVIGSRCCVDPVLVAKLNKKKSTHLTFSPFSSSVSACISSLIFCPYSSFC